MLKRVSVLIISIVFLMGFFVPTPLASQENLVANQGFESGSKSSIDQWGTFSYITEAGVTDFSIDSKVYRTGGGSAAIVNHSSNDSRFKQEIKVRSGYYYKASCWVKTLNVGSDGKGANISVEGILATSADIKGTSNDWQYIELYGKPDENQTSFTLTLGLGGYGSMNTGTAWFDDVIVQELESLPAGVSAVNLYATDTNTSTSSNSKQNQDSSLNSALYYSILFTFIIIFLFIYYLISKSNKPLLKGFEKSYIFIIVAVGLILRLVVAPLVEGYPQDIGCFKAWAYAAANNLAGFYNSNMFVDYPPTYIYVLYIIGKIAGSSEISTLLIKLPSILADIITACLIYRYSANQLGSKIRLFICSIYIFNPLVMFNTAIWGQVDSFFTMLITIALILLSRDKIKTSSSVFAIAALMKPQAIFFLPVLLFELIRRKRLRYFVESFASGFVTSILVILPFLLSNGPLWIFKLYFKTAGEYPYASLNAFNFHTLLGGNFKSDSISLFVFSYRTWGLIFTAAILIFIALPYIVHIIKNSSLYSRLAVVCKWVVNISTENPALPFLCALILNSGAFIFSPRMHERYMFPVLAIALLAYICSKDRRVLLLFTGFTLTNFINNFEVLSGALREFYHIPSDDFKLRVVSVLNIILFCYLIKIVINLVYTSSKVKQKGSAADTSSGRRA
ncbi:MAG: glycosyltransferase 87 family protein [Clostridia bacterium]|nr:glycosyltransferase 87 family protein [Clostridia bacterium]